jgi:hypothetical protein
MFMKIIAFGTFGLALAASVGSAAAEISRADVAKEINAMTVAATGVVSELQPKINARGLKPADLDDAGLLARLAAIYQKNTGAALEAEADPARAEIRKSITAAFTQVIGKYRKEILEGGQDAFVPAFFRAQMLGLFNGMSGGRYHASATNRTAELINADSAADRQIQDKAVRTYVESLLDKGVAEPQASEISGRLVSYWPMKIGEACASCHERNGLKQQVGQFGGATVVVVENTP